MQILKDILSWIYWHPFRSLIRHMPVSCAYALARMFGRIAYLLAGGKRLQLRREYASAFVGTGADRNAETAVKETFSFWLQTEFEVLLFPAMNARNMDSFVEYAGMEHLDKALSAGKGAMLLFAHFGANQMIMPAIGYKGYAMSQLSAPPTVWVEKMPNRKFSAMGKKALEMRWQQELSLPVKHINIFGSLKGAFVALRNNEILGVAIDGGGGKKRMETDFLGSKALFPTGAIELAMRAQCPVLPVFMIRSGKGRTLMIIEPPLDFRFSDDSESISENLKSFIARFEPYVIKYPSHYLMFLALRRFMETQGDAPFLMPRQRKP